MLLTARARSARTKIAEVLTARTMGASVSAGGGGSESDPHIASVAALIHFNGTHGDDIYGYEDAMGNTIVSYGTYPKFSNVQKKFGATSVRHTPSDTAHAEIRNNDMILGTGDFTAEGWFRLDNVAPGSGVQYLFNLGGYNTSHRVFVFGATGNIGIYDSSIGTGGDLYGAGPTLSNDTWYHVAIVRESGTVRGFVDGVKWAEEAGSTFNDTTDEFHIGAQHSNTSRMEGFYDEVRLTKGVGRYSSDFTPPTDVFPES